jgi:HK97 family phage major capsid protein
VATLQDMLDEQAKIKGELQRMEADDGTTEESDGDYRDTLVSRWEQLDELTKPLIARMEKIRGITRAADNPANLESGDGGSISRWDGGGKSPEFMRRVDPFADLDKVKDRLVRPTEVVSRALTAIEGANKRGVIDGDKAEEATQKSQRLPFVARHCLLTGHDDYVEAFRAYLEDPVQEAQRAAISLTAANGGYMLPYILDPSIVLTNNSSANPFRRVAKVITINSNAWQGVNSAGVNAQWLNETATAADASPTVGQVQIFAKKAAAWVYGSAKVAA